MNIVQIAILLVFIIYHAFNIYTDCKYRKTKNWWHLWFLFIGFSIFFAQGYSPWYKPFAALGVIFVIGILLEMFRQSSPGDTKMLMVSAVFMTSLVPKSHFIHVAVGIVVFHILFFALYTYFFLFKKKGVFNTFREQWITVKSILIPGLPIDKTKIFEHFPGATTIVSGGILYYILFNFVL